MLLKISMLSISSFEAIFSIPVVGLGYIDISVAISVGAETVPTQKFIVLVEKHMILQYIKEKV